MSFDREDGVFRVLVNEEEQYCLWPDYKSIPGGWRDAGVSGSKQVCLQHIETVWTDMRPRSLREFMQGPGQA
ncbi:MbtH-like protein [Herbaspirillum sp. GW103]|uniref:MbtH family protein n=1 Tax=unclassified Herbaspirillum TaxID=2624150 RepID=UPI00025E323E|nr:MULTISPECIES: MbtH family NRPS accessory protein [unclassified Herbaspirillum]EIJ47611.1 MbtH-like protein [Herbaspirillum sp. GW103]NUT61407.1 MbtH family NRPS accessory protein [Herbaspirillum sp. C9C3]